LSGRAFWAKGRLLSVCSSVVGLALRFALLFVVAVFMLEGRNLLAPNEWTKEAVCVSLSLEETHSLEKERHTFRELTH